MSTTASRETSKIDSAHLERWVYIYVRQSSYYQVEHNKESKARQYNLVEWARQLGWPSERIVVVDEDQGKSGACANMRSGFGRVVTAVGQGNVGIVMSLEASRLARNSPDWHNLIYMCRYTGTLIADENGIYDPASSTDRMVLGIRGQMSEMELDTSIHRMVEGRWNKARRGEFLVVPPPGYEIDDLNQIVMTSDELVANAIRMVFCKFAELQCAKRVYVWWRHEGLKFPVRRNGLRSHPIEWTTPTYRIVLYVLHNPIYAGAYAFGRTQTIRELDRDDPRKIRIRTVNTKTWPVLIKDHHPAYISFETFEKNQESIRGNQVMKRHDNDETHCGPAREGGALLQGLARCSHCGRRMNVSYGGGRPSPTATRTLQYRCSVARQVHEVEGKDCQLVGGRRIDAAVVDEFLLVTRQAGAEAAVLARELIEDDASQSEHAWELQIEKAVYEAERAGRQFNAVEPENRLVARTLEARWNACLARVEELKAKASVCKRDRKPLTQQEVQRATRLGADLARVWHANTTVDRDRKRLLRAIIEEVQIRTEQEQYRIKIVWKGGAVSERVVERHRRGHQPANATAKDTVEMIRKLAVEFDDTQIARILNKQDRRTGEGNPFTTHKVATHRNRHGIAVAPKRAATDPQQGPFTADEAAVELGVTSSTIHRWLRSGILPGKQIAAGAPWRIVLSDELRARLTRGDAPEGWLGLTEAARELGMSKSQVAYLVKAQKLPAIRVVVGSRPCWRIDVSKADCSAQGNLLTK